jgi:hypothetical protein
MEIQNSIPCVRCSKTMVKVGAGWRGEELAVIHYHCWSCHALLAVDAKTGEDVGRPSDEAIRALGKVGVLRLIGSTALSGDKYPWTRVPKSERIARV